MTCGSSLFNNSLEIVWSQMQIANGQQDFYPHLKEAGI